MRLPLRIVTGMFFACAIHTLGHTWLNPHRKVEGQQRDRGFEVETKKEHGSSRIQATAEKTGSHELVTAVGFKD
ncbi:hypothetical protein C5167_026554 [Papaver somniferum]|nr:hypothetical protein C5167_026554 [Papaver somniferum]